MWTWRRSQDSNRIELESELVFCIRSQVIHSNGASACILKLNFVIVRSIMSWQWIYPSSDKVWRPWLFGWAAVVQPVAPLSILNLCALPFYSLLPHMYEAFFPVSLATFNASQCNLFSCFLISGALCLLLSKAVPCKRQSSPFKNRRIWATAVCLVDQLQYGR